ncbi:hypothetical protein RN001_012222 [Aquatica leii]|uniref:Uncharacterized protein n=1 Tax=Aquatica leii TaxID=1421715 RepID=A0AAN7NY79_9COLE|nr:hypothetical protein RN001_012222 [Aquatica leii]
MNIETFEDFLQKLHSVKRNELRTGHPQVNLDKQEVPLTDAETSVVPTHNESTSANEPRPKNKKKDLKLQMSKEAFGILKSTSGAQEDCKENYPEVASFVAFIGKKLKNDSTITTKVMQQEMFQILARADQEYYKHPPGLPQYSGGYPTLIFSYYHQPVRSIPTG